jgi:hypothetical protein
LNAETTGEWTPRRGNKCDGSRQGSDLLPGSCLIFELCNLLADRAELLQDQVLYFGHPFAPFYPLHPGDLDHAGGAGKTGAQGRQGQR